MHRQLITEAYYAACTRWNREPMAPEAEDWVESLSIFADPAGIDWAMDLFERHHEGLPSSSELRCLMQLSSAMSMYAICASNAQRWDPMTLLSILSELADRTSPE